METIDGMQKHIARHSIVILLYPTLCIDGSIHLLELMEQVEGIDLHHQITLEERTGEAQIPQQVVVVHLRFSIASATIHRKVGVQRELAWQRHARIQSIMEVIGIDSLKTSLVAHRMKPSHKAIHSQRELIKNKSLSHSIFPRKHLVNTNKTRSFAMDFKTTFKINGL